MFEEYGTFGKIGTYEFCNLESISLEAALKELNEEENGLTPVCSTPRGNKTSTSLTSFLQSNSSSKAIEIWENKEDETEKCKGSIFFVNKLDFCDNKVINDESLMKMQFASDIEENKGNYKDLEELLKERELLSPFQKQCEDVANKTVLRSIRRFFSNMFKIDNITIVRKRLRNAKSDEFIAAIKEMIIKHIFPVLELKLNEGFIMTSEINYVSKLLKSESDSEEFNNLAIFLIRFIGFKPRDCVKYGDEIEIKGDQIQKCLYKYSHPKLIKICKILEFKIIFKCVYIHYLDSLFKNDMTLFTKSDTYMAAFQNMNRLLSIKFNEISSI